MKTFTIAAVMLSLLASLRCLPTPRASGLTTSEEKKKDDRPKVDEKAYKAALERIPGTKGKIRSLGRDQAGRAGQKAEINRTADCVTSRILPATLSPLN